MLGIYVKTPTSTGNIIENNSIINSKYGMVFDAAASNTTVHNNIINNASTFEYHLNNESKLTIDTQEFSSTRIRGETATNQITIQNSGTIKINNNQTIDTGTRPYTSSLTGSTITVDSVGSASSGASSTTSTTSEATDQQNKTASTNKIIPIFK
jgi:parallel beta-helix repeat protein